MKDVLRRIMRRESVRPQGPLSEDDARRIIAQTNASDALEYIEPDARTDEIHFRYLTERISEKEMWVQMKQKWIDHYQNSLNPGVREFFDEQIASSGPR